jgi:hypothetical protein
MSKFVNPVFIATSLEAAIKKAELYCTENPVEYNYRVKFGAEKKERLVKGNADGIAFGAKPEYVEDEGRKRK